MAETSSKISIVVPAYNEGDSLPELVERLEAACRFPGKTFELIVVDDGSTDKTAETLRRLARDTKLSLKTLTFRRNFGKSAALSAGFGAADGDWIVTLDADLQDVPEEIPRLIERLEAGLDLVSGWKRKRRDPWSKRIASRIFNWVTARLTGIPIHDFNSGFKAYRREVIEEIKVYGEMHRYIPVLASYRGFRVGEIEVEHHRRKHGKSKYGPSRFLSGFFDLLTVIMLTRYNSKPLHAFGIMGASLFAIGIAVEIYLTVGWFAGRWWIGDRPVFFLGILFLIIGIQFVFFGLLAEMIAYSSRHQEEYSLKLVSQKSQEPRVMALPGARDRK